MSPTETRATIIEQLRKDALAAFPKIGFPTTKNEDWKYTNVMPLVKNGFEPITTKPELKDTLHLDTIERMKTNRLVFVDGWFNEKYSEILDSKEHLIITPMSSRTENDSIVERFLGKQANVRPDGFSAWNTA